MPKVTVKSVVLTACAAFCVGAATNARADQSLDKWPGFRWQPANRDIYAGIREYAECVVEVRPGEVGGLLALPAGSPNEHDLSLKLVDDTGRCMSFIAFRLDPRVFRGALIEALYRKDFQRSKAGKGTVHLGQASERLQLANCVTRADEKTADRLLLTGPASRQQAQIFQQLAPAFQACRASAFPARDAQILRYEIAEALYRRRSGQEPMPGTAK